MGEAYVSAVVPVWGLIDLVGIHSVKAGCKSLEFFSRLRCSATQKNGSIPSTFFTKHDNLIQFSGTKLFIGIYISFFPTKYF